jgi:hypothetical protein
MRECTETDGSTAKEWAQPTWVRAKPSKPSSAMALENDNLNEIMTKVLW